MELKDKILDSVQQIMKALETIQLSGYSNTKTMCNCIEALNALHSALNACDIVEHTEETTDK